MAIGDKGEKSKPQKLYRFKTLEELKRDGVTTTQAITGLCDLMSHTIVSLNQDSVDTLQGDGFRLLTEKDPFNGNLQD